MPTAQLLSDFRNTILQNNKVISVAKYLLLAFGAFGLVMFAALAQKHANPPIPINFTSNVFLSVFAGITVLAALGTNHVFKHEEKRSFRVFFDNGIVLGIFGFAFLFIIAAL